MLTEQIKVVDLSRVLAGPFCAQMLADMGADVIKVESPQGDENRKWPPILDAGQSCNFASVNRGKRSLTLDLKSPGGREVLDRLAGWADVMLHSFLPATAARLGLDHERLKQINPRLVLCSISGYGARGPLANKPGYDLMVQAFSGAMSTTGYDGGPPTRIGVSYIDMSTGLVAYGGIMTALLRRETTGEGAKVEASLLETSLSLLGYHGVSWLQAGILPRKQGSGGVYQVPYQAFACADGHVLAGAPNERAWSRFCEALEVPELALDSRFQTNVDRVSQRDTLIPILERVFATRTVAEWVERLETAGVAVAPIHTVQQIMEHPQTRAMEMIVEVETPQGARVETVGMPFKLDGVTRFGASAAPDLGADSDVILNDRLGFSPDEVERLRTAGTF